MANRYDPHAHAIRLIAFHGSRDEALTCVRRVNSKPKFCGVAWSPEERVQQRALESALAAIGRKLSA